MRERWISTLLALCLILTLAPAAFAADRMLYVGENGNVTNGWYEFRPAESGFYDCISEDSPSYTYAYLIPAGADQLTDAQKAAVRAKLEYQFDNYWLEDAREQIAAGQQQLDNGRQQLEAAKREYEAKASAVEQYKKNSEAIQNLVNQYNGFLNNAESLPFGTATVEGWYQLVAKAQLAMLGIDAPATGDDFLKMWRDAEFQIAEYEEAARQIAQGEESLREGEEQLAAGKAQLAEFERLLAEEYAALPDPNVDLSGYHLMGQTDYYVGGQTYWLLVTTEMPSITLNIVKSKSVENESRFVDVPTDSYYANPVSWAVYYGITNGTDETHFSPDLPCTRGQIVTLLWRAAGEPVLDEMSGSVSYADVARDAYYAEAVRWASLVGITNGTDENHFSPEDPCTRAQAVTFLYRALEDGTVSALNTFADVTPEDYFYNPVIWAVRYGITNGTDETHFSPYDPCTRAQIVTFLYRALS